MNENEKHSQADTGACHSERTLIDEIKTSSHLRSISISSSGGKVEDDVNFAHWELYSTEGDVNHDSIHS